MLFRSSNNTIYGTEVLDTPEVNVPLICDMSSDFMSHPVDVSKYELIYAGAQKNLGPAGVTIVIVKKDAVGKSGRPIPTMLNYQTHIDKESMFNTPPVLPIYSCLMTLRWYKELGGLKEIEKRNIAKAKLLYDEIDRNELFMGTAEMEDRSRMNVCFVMTPPYKEFEDEFIKYCDTKGIMGLKGHRSVGEIGRASCRERVPPPV